MRRVADILIVKYPDTAEAQMSRSREAVRGAVIDNWRT